LEVIKSAFQSNWSLEELYIHNELYIEHGRKLELLLQGIASAPKLRTLSLKLFEFDEFGCSDLESEGVVLSPQELRYMFARTLKECKNSSLEVFVGNFVIGPTLSCDKKIWNREVVPIFEFNHEGRLFLENASSFAEGEQLLRALVHAERTDNHHFRFWLVRNHAGDLRCGTIGQAPSRLGKRKTISK
jgi:hypothetical protein